MMKLMLNSLTLAWHYQRKDKIILFFSTIPIVIGSLLYYWLGAWLFTDVLGAGKAWIVEKLSDGSFGNILYYLLVGIFTAALFFIINWTFVLVVSLIGAPFNDIISSRVMKLIDNEKQDDLKETFSALLKNVFRTVWNEIKKIIVIIGFSLIALLLSMIPILLPVSIGITALLLASEFLDYSWSRDKLSIGKCFGNLTSKIMTNTLSGLIFLVLMTVPIVNLIAFPYGVVYFTILYTKRKKQLEPHLEESTP